MGGGIAMEVRRATDAPATIVTTRAGRGTQILAACLAALLLLSSLAILPFGSLPGPAIPAFLPIFATGVVIGDIITAYLLYHQARLLGVGSVHCLAASYLFTGSIAAFQLLVFPGVFSATGLIGAGPQSAVWLWMFWHGGFAAYVIAYAILSRQERRRPFQDTHRRHGLIMILTALLVGALALLTTLGHDLLPALVVSGDYRRSFELGVAPLVLALNVAAVILVLTLTRLGTVVQTWLWVASLASLLDAIVTLSAGARFSIGWYGARVDSLVTAGLLLIAFQREMVRLYGDVVALNQRLARIVDIDGLTGIATRRRFDQALGEEGRRCVRARQPLSLLMMDVDFFKSFNDQFGHPAGDACLIQVARAIAESVGRPGDLAARYGGEEFVLLAPATDAAGAAALGHRVGARVRALGIEHPHGIDGRVTISIGVATVWPQPDEDGRQLIAAADRALYRAKAAGRDRIELDVALPRAAPVSIGV